MNENELIEMLEKLERENFTGVLGMDFKDGRIVKCETVTTEKITLRGE